MYVYIVQCKWEKVTAVEQVYNQEKYNIMNARNPLL